MNESKDDSAKRPEELDAHFDMLDLTGEDRPERRLALVTLVISPPETIADILRNEPGPEGGGTVAWLPEPVTR